MRRTIAALAACAAMAAVVPPAMAASQPKPHVLKLAESPAEQAPTAGDLCGPPVSDPVPDGQSILVTMPPGPSFTVGQIPATWWKVPPYGDGVWQLHLRGFFWAMPLAARAAQDDQQQSLTALVDQMLAFHKQNPDPGTSTATTTANANAWGWDEGTALRRLEAENCLYSVTRDARLIPVMTADVNVQYGTRYYGPPLHGVHNHGVMADLAVIHAGDLLKRTDWLNRSMDRLLTNSPSPWTPSGMTIEQSSSYHLTNVILWRQAADVIQAHRGAAAVAQMRTLDARANSVTPWLTEPDRRVVVLGDSFADPGQTRSSWTGQRFRDDVAGLAVGRWSWTDPATSYYTIRYGPRRWAHGQQERPGVTWSTLGTRILVGPGKGVFDTAGNYYAWVRGQNSHNVTTADGRTFKDAPVKLASVAAAATWHSYTTTDALYGIAHTRKMTIAKNPRWLTVVDTYAGSAAFRQWWHLDSGWGLTSKSADGKRLVFTKGARVLTVTTTGTTALAHGVTRPVGGWNFPRDEVRTAAWQIGIAAKGTATTTFTPR